MSVFAAIVVGRSVFIMQSTTLLVQVSLTLRCLFMMLIVVVMLVVMMIVMMVPLLGLWLPIVWAFASFMTRTLAITFYQHGSLTSSTDIAELLLDIVERNVLLRDSRLLIHFCGNVEAIINRWIDLIMTGVAHVLRKWSIIGVSPGRDEMRLWTL